MDYKIEKDWKHKNQRCVVIMHPAGHRCGYVGFDKENPFYGIGYRDKPNFLKKYLPFLKQSELGRRGVIPLLCYDGENISPDILFNVHGSITYGDGGKNSKYPVESDLWWFGYDCAHSGDAKDLSVIENEATREVYSRYNEGEIRTLEYCISECESLVDQIMFIVDIEHKIKSGQKIENLIR